MYFSGEYTGGVYVDLVCTFSFEYTGDVYGDLVCTFLVSTLGMCMEIWCVRL